jgi:hypothetical protein
MMPPTDLRRPDAATYEAMIAWLEANSIAAPRRTRRRRAAIGSTERSYANIDSRSAGLPIDPAKYLPSDDSTSGFDNIAGALGISSTLVEAYVTAAQKISRLALGEPKDRTSSCTGPARIRRRTITSRACRSARAAACSSSTCFPRRRLHNYRHADLRRQT